MPKKFLSIETMEPLIVFSASSLCAIEPVEDVCETPVAAEPLQNTGCLPAVPEPAPSASCSGSPQPSALAIPVNLYEPAGAEQPPENSCAEQPPENTGTGQPTTCSPTPGAGEPPSASPSAPENAPADLDDKSENCPSTPSKQAIHAGDRFDDTENHRGKLSHRDGDQGGHRGVHDERTEHQEHHHRSRGYHHQVHSHSHSHSHGPAYAHHDGPSHGHRAGHFTDYLDDDLGTSAEPRTVDGTNNNQEHPNFGAVGTQQLRLSSNDGDRLLDPDLPSPREVSNAVHAQDSTKLNVDGHSDFLWVWGQFVDHDITLTGGHSGEAANIAVPKGDAFFDPQQSGEAVIQFERSNFMLDAYGERQQSNSITAFVDASQVYGSDEQVASSLRAFQGGQMLVSVGNMMPTHPTGETSEQFQFSAGDVRSNENVALTSMHTLFVREHNRLAGLIAEHEFAGRDLMDPKVDEAIYQRARSLVAAELQHITYSEFLPALLGEDALEPYRGYDPEVNPGISNEFSTAAFRVGHTMLSSELLRLDAQGNEIEEGNLALRDAFFRPDKVLEAGIDPILRGLAQHRSQEVDTYLVDDVRNFLFGPPGSGGFDLASLNIQRGRDHELPGYNDVREALGLECIASFEEISSDPEVVEKLKSVYENVDQVDLWVGGLAEDHIEGATIGETFSTIIRDQFERLRDGDRYWYEESLSGKDLAYVKSLNLSTLIRLNSEADLQDNVFFAKESKEYYV